MSNWAHELTRPPRLGAVLLWSVAALAAVAAHAGAVALVLREQPQPLVSDGPPPAIMLELAAMPEAPETEDTQAGEQQQDLAEVEPEEAEPEETEEPAPEEPQEELAEVEKAEVPIVSARPAPRPKREIRREEPRRERPREERRQQQNRAASEQARQSDRKTAVQSGAGQSASPAMISRWEARLQAHLARRKRYPSGAESRREQGTPHVSFRIDQRGNVVAISLARSSGYPELDQAAVQAVQRASPVPQPPPGARLSFTVPMEYKTRR